MQLDECINFILTKTQNAVFSQFKNTLAPLGVTPAQYAVLKCLWDNESLSPTQLAQTLFLEASTITGIITRMEDKNLVERHYSLTDRRVVSVHATALGKSLQGDVEKAIDEANKDVLGVLTKSEISKVKQLLNRIAESVNKSA